MNARASLAVVAALGLAPATAAADHDGYRLQVVGVDLAADALMISCFVAKEPACRAGQVGVALFVVGGPTVHFAHEHVGRGFTSLGVRVGAPLLGALAGLALARGEGGNTVSTRVTGGMIGLGVGLFAAQVLDATLIAGPTDHADATPRLFSVGGSF